MAGRTVAVAWLLLSSSAAAAAEVIIAREVPFALRAPAHLQFDVDIRRVEGPPRLEYDLASEDAYLRYVRIYANGRHVLTRVVRSRARGRIDLSALVRGPGRLRIIVALENAASRPWVLKRARLHGVTGTVAPEKRQPAPAAPAP